MCPGERAPAPKALSEAERSEFQGLVYAKALENRRDFPWRDDPRPWPVLVSEIMLQQTQAERVVPKFEAWMSAFPTPAELAAAPIAAALAHWSGLGYNRRALALRGAAVSILNDFGGEVPSDETALRSLPGVGLYTARAVLAFAFNIPTVFLETNIRTVYVKHFFQAQLGVEDTELAAIGAQVLDARAPARWYNALMDYGAGIKRVEGNFSRATKSWRAQEPFRTSKRRIRGAIIKSLVEFGPEKTVPLKRLASQLSYPSETVEACVLELSKEGFLEYSRGTVRIKS